MTQSTQLLPRLRCWRIECGRMERFDVFADSRVHGQGHRRETSLVDIGRGTPVGCQTLGSTSQQGIAAPLSRIPRRQTEVRAVSECLREAWQQSCVAGLVKSEQA